MLRLSMLSGVGRVLIKPKNEKKERYMTLLAPEKIDVTTLPSVRFEERRALPQTPGVYFALIDPATILYIGQAKSLLFRWHNHHRVQEFYRIENLRIAYIEIEDGTMLTTLEKSFIHYFDPPLNRPTPPLLRWRNRGKKGYIHTP